MHLGVVRPAVGDDQRSREVVGVLRSLMQIRHHPCTLPLLSDVAEMVMQGAEIVARLAVVQHKMTIVIHVGLDDPASARVGSPSCWVGYHLIVLLHTVLPIADADGLLVEG